VIRKKVTGGLQLRGGEKPEKKEEATSTIKKSSVGGRGKNIIADR